MSNYRQVGDAVLVSWGGDPHIWEVRAITPSGCVLATPPDSPINTPLQRLENKPGNFPVVGTFITITKKFLWWSAKEKVFQPFPGPIEVSNGK